VGHRGGATGGAAAGIAHGQRVRSRAPSDKGIGMTLGQRQIGGAFRTRAGAGNLIGRDRRLRPERAWSRSERVLVGGGRTIDPAVDVDGPKRAGAEHHATTTTTTGAVIIGSAARVGGPGVRAGAAARVDG